MALVAPGGSPKTKSQQALATTSGHIIHLMPGDHSYDLPEIPIVIVWNGTNHYSPTYMADPTSILKWKISLISRHLFHACNIFGEIQGDLKDEEDQELCQTFNNLNFMAREAKDQIETWSGVPNVALPVTNLGPDPRDVKTSKSRTTSLPRHPKHFIKGQMNLVEKVADISKAEEEGEPLIPVFTSSLEADIKGPMYRQPDSEILMTAGDSRTGITSTVESHPAPIVSSRASDFKFKFPDIPDQARKVKDDFYFPLGEYLQVTHDLLKKWEVAVVPVGHSASPAESKPSTSSASQVVTSTETLHSTGFWESTKPIPRIPPTTTTSDPIVTEIPMEVDEDVIFLDEKPMRPILGRKSKKQAKLASSSAIPVRQPPVGTPASGAIPVRQPTVGTPASGAIPVTRNSVSTGQLGAIPVTRPLIQSRLNYGRPVFPSPTLLSASHSGTHAIPQTRATLMVSIPYLPPPIVPPTPPQAQPPQSLQLPKVVSQVVSEVVASMTSSSSSSQESTQKKGSLQLIKCIQPGCSYSSYNKGDFRIHMDKHLGVRYKCTLCAKDFGSDKARKTHFRTVHLGQARSLCSFPHCNFSHNDHGVTRVHQYIEHGFGEAPKCQHPDCKDRDMFSNWRVFERHREGYHKEKDSQCPHCQKMYKGHHNLNYHLANQHKGLPAFQCDQCGNFFSSQKSLKVHQDSQH